MTGAAFLLPLAFLPNLVDEFVLPKLLLARVLVAVLLILLVIRWFRDGQIGWRRTALDLPLLTFLATAALSTIFAINQSVAVFGTYDRWEGLLTIVTYAVLFWLAVQMLSGGSEARGVVWSLLISGYVVGAVAILQSGFGLFNGGYNVEPNGFVRADATLANPDFTGIFLAMLLPLAFGKLMGRRSAVTRVLAANLVVVLLLGMVVTLSRAAWIGAVIGAITVLVLRRGRFHAWPLVISGALVAAGFLVSLSLAASTPVNARTGTGHTVLTRIASITDLSSGTEALRLATWGDTVRLIASRPLFGYGPDTFGLVYPQFQSTNKNGQLWDKPHMDALGVASSQGILGLIAYIWILVAIVRAFWKGRYRRGAVALFGGWVAYVVSIQADFSYIPTSFPYWLLVAAAIVTWAPDLKTVRVATFPARTGTLALAAGALLLLILMVPAVIMPYLADADYYATPSAPDLVAARATIAQARQLAPYEATYAIEAGNYALNLDQNGNPARNADWTSARAAYETAARLGSFSPEMFQELALVDEHLGDHAAALAAARRALELDRYDVVSQKLLAQLSRQ